MRRANLLEFFRDYFTSPAEYIVYDDGYRRWTYSFAQTGRAARVFQERLRQAGIRKGDRIILWSEPRPEWLFAFWGSLLAGAVVVPIGSEAPADFVRRVRDIVQPRVLAAGDDTKFEEHDPSPVWRLTAQNWNDRVAAVEFPQIGRDDLAEIVFTSGSTGEPKACRLPTVTCSHRSKPWNPRQRGIAGLRGSSLRFGSCNCSLSVTCSAKQPRSRFLR